MGKECMLVCLLCKTLYLLPHICITLAKKLTNIPDKFKIGQKPKRGQKPKTKPALVRLYNNNNVALENKRGACSINTCDKKFLRKLCFFVQMVLKRIEIPRLDYVVI